VRFQTSKTIHAEDSELVLSILETCLRELSLDSVRSGTEIALHGLGPSPRVINRTDTTILRVESKEDQTVITADVSFQPSCLLSDTPQELVVESKLDHIFDQVKGEIEFAQRRRPSRSQFSTTSSQTRFSAAVIPSPQFEEPPPKTEVSYFAELPEAKSTAPTMTLELEEEIKPIEDHGREERVLVEPGPLKSTWVEQAPARATQSGKTIRIIVPTVVCVALLIAGAFYHLRVPNKSVTLPSPVVGPAPPLNTASALPDKSVVGPAPALVASHVDLRTWLEDLGSAMRTRDALAQSGFYADPVDNYLGKHNVSRAEILSEKQTAIQKRSGLWTVKLEKISLKPSSSDVVSVHLVKHYIAQTRPAQISEQFVPALLQLQRRGGQWKITSETELPKRRSAN
jgi:hypothetical protein